MSDLDPNQASRHNSNASSTGGGANSEPPECAHPTGYSKAPAPSDKTISCVSCRKRKLKCDRVKPKCGTCTRLRHECEFPERKRNVGSKRRNMKELEARLAQVETQLGTESKMAATFEPQLSAFGTEPDWNSMNVDMDANLGMSNGGLIDSDFGASNMFGLPSDPLNPTGDFFSQELIALGLQEPLPAQEMMDELTAIYFNTLHKTLPFIHKYRFYASLDRPAHMRPPVCLRYAMWMSAASISEKYRQYEGILYERARRYLHQDEMKGHGEHFVSVYYVQAWALTAAYEATKTFFSRSWMSSGRCVRLCHMLGLQRVDGDSTSQKRILPVAKDWIELEERRRAFWSAFYVDRWASSGTGWPMLIDETDIMTNLPSSESAFESGVQQPGISLAAALTPEGASKVSSFGGIILSATLFGHNFQHLHKVGPDENPHDLANGNFWKRHRKMDNVLSNTFMFLPDHLKLPAGIGDPNVALTHMNIHASTICLHQAAIITAEKHKLNPNFKQQCRSRSLTAAEEITNIMRMITHIETTNLSTWTGFCLYVAAGVLVQDKKLDPNRATSLNNLDFLLNAMRALGKKHTITNHFTAQLELDIEASGIRNPVPFAGDGSPPRVPAAAMFAERSGLCSIMDEMNAQEGYSIDPLAMPDMVADVYHEITTPLTVLPASSRDGSELKSSKVWNWERSSDGVSINDIRGSIGSIRSNYMEPKDGISGVADACPYAGTNGSSATSSTPPSDTPTPNSTQYPIRQNEEHKRIPHTKLPGILPDWQSFNATDTTRFYTPGVVLPETQVDRQLWIGGLEIDGSMEFSVQSTYQSNGRC